MAGFLLFDRRMFPRIIAPNLLESYGRLVSDSDTPSRRAFNLIMARKRGNPEWGSSKPREVRTFPSEFEIETRRLGLTIETCAASYELRRWCERNKDRCYIPEWLLKDRNIQVNPNAAWPARLPHESPITITLKQPS
jgi:hypothetical protein